MPFSVETLHFTVRVVLQSYIHKYVCRTLTFKQLFLLFCINSITLFEDPLLADILSQIRDESVSPKMLHA